jgi:hypothetical protein
MILLYNSLVLPYLQYGISIWGAAKPTYLNTLFISQKKAIKTALSLPWRTSTNDLFSQSKIIPLENIYQLRVALFMYKFENSLLPFCFQNYFQSNNQLHQFNTRSSTLYHIPLFSTSYCQQSILFQGPKLWTKIPDYIRNSTTICRFKYKIKSYLAEQWRTNI